MPFAVPSQRGFTKSGKSRRERRLARSRGAPDHDLLRHGHARRGDQPVRPGLVERHRQGRGVRSQCRDPRHREQHGRPGLALAPAPPLRDRHRGVELGQLALRRGLPAAHAGPRASRCDARASPGRLRAAPRSLRARTPRPRPAGRGAGADRCRAGRTRGRSRATSRARIPRRTRETPRGARRGGAMLRTPAGARCRHDPPRRAAADRADRLQRPGLRGDVAEVSGHAARLAQRSDGGRAGPLPRRARDRLLRIWRAHAPAGGAGDTRGPRRAAAARLRRGRVLDRSLRAGLPVAVPRGAGPVLPAAARERRPSASPSTSRSRRCSCCRRPS